jgi:hypothetical protein
MDSVGRDEPSTLRLDAKRRRGSPRDLLEELDGFRPVGGADRIGGEAKIGSIFRLRVRRAEAFVVRWRLRRAARGVRRVLSGERGSGGNDAGCQEAGSAKSTWPLHAISP